MVITLPQKPGSMFNSGLRTLGNQLGKKSFDLVITDIEMPCGGGERVLNEISASDIEVFVFSDNVNQDDREIFKRLEAKGVFAKPESLTYLIEKCH